MTDADVRYEETDDALIVEVRGEIDMSNADDLRAAITARMATRSRGLVLDLSGLEYLDSAGIHLLFVLRSRLAARGERLDLVVPAGSAAEAVLRYAGVIDELG